MSRCVSYASLIRDIIDDVNRSICWSNFDKAITRLAFIVQREKGIVEKCGHRYIFLAHSNFGFSLV